MSVTKMAGICSLNPTTLMTIKRIHGIRCCSGATDNEKKSQIRTKTPQILKLVVSGVTELLRVFSFSGKERLEKVNNKDRDEISVSGIDDVIMILKSDYENAYFGFSRQQFMMKIVSLKIQPLNSKEFPNGSETIFNQILVSNCSMMCYIVDEVYNSLLALLGIQSSFPLLFDQRRPSSYELRSYLSHGWPRLGIGKQACKCYFDNVDHTFCNSIFRKWDTLVYHILQQCMLVDL
ncbi:hypothetical protein NC653_030653 [Populus alba x Populus x berolinensis]|uniref:Uncharacterized protein n=1 Tax=Populus alba x Populus x berolinensis TaxID=444605 RepID=A0AAD6Q0N3_9ROSI|nr:hypothetical protein NC653_030653 [Populus alba x Populus x berolinensis]